MSEICGVSEGVGAWVYVWVQILKLGYQY